MKPVRYFNREQLEEIFYKDKKDLAFVKHFSYEEEKEIRIVYREKKGEKKSGKMPPSIIGYLEKIPKDSIRSVRFSPYVSKDLFEFVKEPLYKFICKYE